MSTVRSVVSVSAFEFPKVVDLASVPAVAEAEGKPFSVRVAPDGIAARLFAALGIDPADYGANFDVSRIARPEGDLGGSASDLPLLSGRS